MQTYTHYVMTAVLNRQLKHRGAKGAHLHHHANESEERRLPPLASRWLMIGSIMPDIPLILLSVGAMILDLLAGNRMDPGNEHEAIHSYTGYLFRVAFFHDPWVQTAHNLFHAPFLIILYVAVGYWAWRQGRRWGAGLFWFGLACALHTAVDIPLHHDDGPLVFFPFDWQTRFMSPVSYWDPRYHGRPFAIFEHLLLLGMLFYLAVTWWQQRRKRTVTSVTE
ncbi:MAG: hypothetical protein R3C14_17175 [Caldilineaceae bacterium]